MNLCVFETIKLTLKIKFTQNTNKNKNNDNINNTLLCANVYQEFALWSLNSSPQAECRVQFQHRSISYPRIVPKSSV